MSRSAELIQTIYDAAIEPRRWETALLRIGRVVDGDVLALVGSPGHPPCFTSGADPHSVDTRHEYIMRFEAQYNVMQTLPLGQPSTLEEMVGERNYLRSEMYVDWVRPQGVRHWLFSKVCQHDANSVGLGIGRAHWKPAFDAAQRRSLACLLPHLQSAVALAAKIGDLESECNALAGLLDVLPMAVALCDGRGVLRRTNRAADLLLSAADGITADRNGLRASTSKETSALRALLLRAAATGNGNGDGAGDVITLRRPSGRRPLQAFVMPLGRDTSSGWDAHRPAAAVFVSDPEATPPPPAARLAAAYGLTAAQANVAVGLAAGRSLREIADAAGVRENTVRAHLKEIFAKTETRRQAELVRLLLTGPLRMVVGC